MNVGWEDRMIGWRRVNILEYCALRLMVVGIVVEVLLRYSCVAVLGGERDCCCYPKQCLNSLSPPQIVTQVWLAVAV